MPRKTRVRFFIQNEWNGSSIQKLKLIGFDSSLVVADVDAM